jgi:hypothetical protein
MVYITKENLRMLQRKEEERDEQWQENLDNIFGKLQKVHEKIICCVNFLLRFFVD